MPAAGGSSRKILEETVMARVMMNRKIIRLLPRRSQIVLEDAGGVSLGMKKCITAAGIRKLTMQGMVSDKNS